MGIFNKTNKTEKNEIDAAFKAGRLLKAVKPREIAPSYRNRLIEDFTKYVMEADDITVETRTEGRQGITQVMVKMSWDSDKLTGTLATLTNVIPTEEDFNDAS
jgi:hypothetical protein